MRTIFTTTFALILASPAFAEDVAASTSPPPPPAIDLPQFEASRSQVRLHRSPDSSIGSGFAGTGIEFLADGDDKTISLTGSRNWQADRSDILMTSAWTAKLFTDITDKRDSSGFFVTDYGRVKGTGLQLSFGQVWSNNPKIPTTPAYQNALRREVTKACLADPEVSRREDGKFCTKVTTGTRVMAEALTDDRYAAAVESAIGAEAWSTVRTWSYNLDIAAASKSFKVRDTQSYKEASVEKIETSVSASFGTSWVPGPIGRLYGGAGVAHKRSFKEAKSQILCPVSGSSVQECFQGAFAEPERKDETVLFVVVRNQADWRIFDVPYVLQLRAAHDFDNEVSGLETSLFIFSGNKSWKGGLRFKLQTDDNSDKTEDENSQIGLFVSKGF